MQLADRFTYAFPEKIRKDGFAYHIEGRVTPFHVTGVTLLAFVAGTDVYTVGMLLDKEDDVLLAGCTCPYYDQTGPCKHIWAVFLAASRMKSLSAANNPRTLLGGLDPKELEEIVEEVGVPEHLHTRLMGGLSASAVQPDERSGRKGPAAGPPDLHRSFAALKERVSRAMTEWPQVRRNDNREILYVINAYAAVTKRTLVINVGHREPKKNGEWSATRFTGIRTSEIENLPNEIDRQILSLLTRSEGTDSWRYYYDYSSRMEYEVSPAAAAVLLPLMSRAGRLYLSRTGDMNTLTQLRYDAGGDWKTFLRIDRAEENGGKPAGEMKLQAMLGNGREEVSVADVERTLPGNLVMVRNRLLPLSGDESAARVEPFLREQPLIFPSDRLDNVLEEIAAFPPLPPLRSSDAVPLETVEGEPQPVLRLARKPWRGSDALVGTMNFDYGGVTVRQTDARISILDPKERRVVLRNSDREQVRIQELHESDFQIEYGGGRHDDTIFVRPRKFAGAVEHLIGLGWTVLADGKHYRTGGRLDLRVSSGIDWFDLEGTAAFDDAGASLPELLKAIANGETMVLLDDGSYGLLPAEWISRYGRLAKAAKPDGSALRFGSNQIVLLDMLLAEMPEARIDETFRNARERLRSFEGILPVDPPDSFTGTLRPYQKTAVGWFAFLREFGFGGCLADDMGLGKTVQALALLEERRLQRIARPTAKKGRKKEKKSDVDGPVGPSLAVVPKSLIFNWIKEAERFTPELRVLDYTGTARKEFHGRLDEFDLVLTTYGTLRRDVPTLRQTEFDYVILDESQAIKNEKSATAKAVRLLNGRHRLAMSGTPIENRLEELWSLFDFLNPGMLGGAPLFNALAGSHDSDQARTALARSLRPFILRRTKESVAADLPEKVEQTIYCELDKTQRKLYNELRDHFRASVLHEIDAKGMARSKMKVLEALLRLRQAACHPALIDRKKAKLDCAKFDVLLPQLEEIVEEGHKALVFSQFTSFLALLKPMLDAKGIGYVYLDGKTRDRQAKVEQFQKDPDASLFLISLKAGGVGLNLTAAEYVFLLDPWWNPAVEAQAIDRTHRIGQTNNVFAYRLIAQDTVEEKVLKLQEEKRELADAIITGDNALIRDLAREDLELLLS